MKIVKQGEKAERAVLVHGDLVRRVHVTLNKPTQAEYQLDWSFDFSDVSREELMTIASRAILIAMRPEFKGAKASELPAWEVKTFSVRDYLDSERAKVDDVEKARRMIGKLTPEQRAAIRATM